MSIDLSIAGIFAEVFGYSSAAFDPKLETVIGHQEKDVLRMEQGMYGAPYYGTDAITGYEYYLPVWLNGVELPHPVVSITGRKTIVETPLTERDGTVKEIIALNDYEIVIRGLIIGKYNELPEAQLKELKDLFETRVPVSITNAITDIYLKDPKRGGSSLVVIKEHQLPEVRGGKNVRPYQLTLLSDAPFNLIDLS